MVLELLRCSGLLDIVCTVKNCNFKEFYRFKQIFKYFLNTLKNFELQGKNANDKKNMLFYVTKLLFCSVFLAPHLKEKKKFSELWQKRTKPM